MVRRSPNQRSRPLVRSQSHPTDFPDTIAIRSRSEVTASSVSTFLRRVRCHTSAMMSDVCANIRKIPATMYHL